MWTNRRFVVIGLAISLLVNVFLVGFVGGHVLSTHRSGVKPAPAPGPVIQPGHVNALPADEKTTFQAAMSAHREAIRDARKTLRAARATVEQDIGAPTYDRDKVSADFAALRKANMAVQEAVNDGVIEALSGLSQASRSALVRHSAAKAGAP